MTGPEGGSKLRIRLFGGVAVERDGIAVELPQSRKTRALLGFLAVTGKAQRRERLCEILWDLPDDPKASLRWSLSRLRPLVDETGRRRIIADRNTAALDLADVDVDLTRVRAAAEEPHCVPIDELRRAGDALEGPLLERLDMTELREYQAWLVAERETARLAAKGVLAALVQRLSPDAADAAVGYARKLAAIAADDENAHGMLVAALVASGRKAEAGQQAEIALGLLAANGGSNTGVVRRALSSTPSPAVAAAKGDKPSIAVLPFANSGAGVDAYLVDGIVDAITDALACYTWLFVIARQSAFALKADGDPRAAANALGVRYLLTGSVMRDGDRVRVACRLIDGETGAQVWLERFDRSTSDIFALQDEISVAVASSLQPTIIAADTRRAGRKPTQALDAYDYYLRALPFVYTPQGRGQSDAIALLEEALRCDPQFAVAMAMLANLRLQNRAYLTPTGIEESLRLARQAAQLGRDDARVLSLAGFIIGYASHDFDAADALIARALAVNPNSYAAWTAQAWAHIYWGDVAKAEPCLDMAERLSPLDPFHYLLQTARASALYQTGRYAEALRQARAAAASNPAFETSLHFLVASLVELGRLDEASVALAQLRAAAPHQDLAFLRRTLPFRPTARAERLVAALSRAGLPERLAPS